MPNGNDLTPDQFMAQKPGQAAVSQSSLSPDQFMAQQKGTQKKAGPSLWERLNKPLISAEAIRGVVPGDMQKTTERAIVAGDPTKAALSAFAGGVGKDVSEIASSMTSPAALGLAAASGGESALASRAPMLARLLKIPQFAALIGYGAQGAKQAVTPQQPGESTPQALERRLMGAATVAGSAAGSGAVAKDSVRNALRKNLGLNDDLAKEVSEHIAQKTQVEQETQRKLETIRTAGEQAERSAGAQTAQKVAALDQQVQQNIDALRGQTAARISNATRAAEQQIQRAQAALPALEKQKIQSGSRVLQDTTKYLHQRKAEFKTMFGDLDSKITKPVTTPEEVSSLIEREFKDKGITANEVPPAALKALKNEADVSPRPSGRLTNNELRASQLAAGMAKRGMSEAETRSALVNLGYAPRQVQSIMSVVRGTQGEGGMTSGSVTRVRSDLYDAAMGSKDPAVKSALLSSYEKLSDVQERAFDEAGFGKEYKAAKNQYSEFMRGINSDVVHKLLASYDAEDQGGPALDRQIKLLTDSSVTPALKTILRSADVDTGDLDAITKMVTETQRIPVAAERESRSSISWAQRLGTRQETAARRTGESEISATQRAGEAEARRIRSETSKQMREITSEGARGVKEAEAEGKIVPGKKASELAGISNAKLLRERLIAQANSMKSAGIRSPFALIQNLVGILQLARGSAWGFFHIGRGLSATEIPNLVKNPKFQNWVLRDTGVEPSSIIGKQLVYAAARKLAASGAPSAMTATAASRTSPTVP